MGELSDYYSAIAQVKLNERKPSEVPVRFRMYWSKQGSHWRVRIFGRNNLNGVLYFDEKEYGVFSSFALINTTLIEWLEERGDQ